MTSLNPFVVLRSKGFVYEVLGDTPTPALIDASNDGRPHDAYQHPETGFWRLADPKYDAPGTEYTSVYVSRLPECPGFEGRMPHLVEWGEKLDHGPAHNVCRDCVVDTAWDPDPDEREALQALGDRA